MSFGVHLQEMDQVWPLKYIVCIYMFTFRQHGGIVQLLNTSSPQIALSNNGKIIKVITGVIH